MGMRKPGTDENDVQMTDVLCDFCEREWSEDIPMMEGHEGSCVCGNCLKLAYADVVLNGHDSAPDWDWQCPLCLEKNDDRTALNRADEPGWQSPIREEAVLCRRCLKMGAGVLGKDPEMDWEKPEL